jgi:DMSO/TMAO reductase YedYZ molybdopterin-dependent catalytic subunit
MLMLSAWSFTVSPQPSASPPPTATTGGPSDSFTVGGAVQTPMTFTLAALQALPPMTLTAETRTRQGSQGAHSYTGAMLKAVVDRAQVRPGADRRNGPLNRLIVLTGSDGYRATVAYGEIDPDGAAQQIIVAYAMDGTPLGPDGLAERIVPGDKLAGRWVKNIVRVTVVEPTVTGPASAAGGSSPSFALGGAVQTPGTFTLGNLQSLPTTMVTTEVRTDQGSQGKHTFTGVLLRDLLDRAKVQADPNRKNDTLGMFVTIIGSDDYRVSVAFGEFDPDFGNQQILVAYAEDGAPLGEHGMAQLIVPADNVNGRWVWNIVSLTLGTPV